jgi:hypothetical protein
VEYLGIPHFDVSRTYTTLMTPSSSLTAASVSRISKKFKVCVFIGISRLLVFQAHKAKLKSFNKNFVMLGGHFLHGRELVLDQS